MEDSDLRKKTGEGTAFFKSVIETADYMMDMCVSNQRKKRVRVDVKDSRWDKSYLLFLVDLQQYCEAKTVEEDDEEDPTYAMFLEKLKEHGKSYMLDVSVEHGICTPIVYEVDTSKRKSPRAPQGTNVQKKRRLDVNQQSKSKRKYSRTVDQDETDSFDTVKKLKIKSGFDAKLKSGQKNSGFVNVAETSPSSVLNKETSRNREHYNFRKKASVEAKGQSKSNKKNSRSVNEVESDSMETPTTQHGYNMRKRGALEADKQLKSGRKDSAFVCKVEKDPLDEIKKTSISRQGNQSRKEGSSLNRKTSHSCQDGNIQKRGDVHVDIIENSSSDLQEANDTYKSFISGLKIVGESMIYEYGDHQQIFYEVDDQQMSTDDEISNSSSRLQVPTPSFTEPITTPTPLSPATNHNMPKTSEEPIPTPTPLSPTTNRNMPNTSEKPIPPPTPLSPTTNHNMPNTSEELIPPPTPLSPISNHNMPNTSAEPVPPSTPSSPTTNYYMPNTSEEPIPTPTPSSSTTNHNMPYTSEEPNTTRASPAPTINLNRPNTSVTGKAHDKIGKGSRKDHSKLWRKLQRIVEKPFDQNEYDDLWEAMNKRSEVQIYRDSRSGGTYKPGHMGKSYLDKYPELNAEIQKVLSDSCKVLSLLRMLCFYLKKVPHGIPRPWMPGYRKMFLP